MWKKIQYFIISRNCLSKRASIFIVDRHFLYLNAAVVAAAAVVVAAELAKKTSTIHCWY